MTAEAVSLPGQMHLEIRPVTLMKGRGLKALQIRLDQEKFVEE